MMKRRPLPRLALSLSVLLCSLALPHGPASASGGKAQAAGRARAQNPARRAPRRAPAEAPAARPAPAPEGAPLRLVVQQGHGTFAHGFAAFSPDGRLVATGAAGDVVVWDVATGREVRRLAGNEGDPGAQDVDGWLWGAFSPDSRLLATSVGPNLRLWDVRTGRLLWKRSHLYLQLVRVDGERPPVSFSPDGRRVVVETDSGHRFTWDAASGRLAAHAAPRVEKEAWWTEQAPRSAVSPGGKFTARAADGLVVVAERGSGAEAGRVRFRQPAAGAAEVAGDAGGGQGAGREQGDDGLLALAVSPDGRALLVAERVGEDGHAVRLWDVSAAAPLHDLSGRRGELTDFHFTHAGGLLTFASEGRAVRALDVLTGRQVNWEVAGAGVYGIEVSPDGRFVATNSGVHGQVWDAQTGAQLARVEAEPPAGTKPEEFGWDFAGFTPGETATFFKQLKGEGYLRFRLGTGDWKEKQVGGTQTMRYAQEPDTTVKGFVLTRDQRAAAWETDDLFEGEPDGTKWMTVWSADPKVRNSRFKIDRDEAYNDPSLYALSPDGRRVLVATSNGGGDLPHTSVKVWDADAKRALFKLAAPGFRVGALDWSPDGRHLATGADDGTTIIWDAPTGRQLRRLAGQRDNVYAVKFSPDGRHLLTLCADGFARLFVVQTGAELCRFITFGDGSWVVVAPDGRFDADDLEEVRGVHWVAPDDPLKPLPLEIFMRDYYEPRLLARLLAGETFEPVRSLAELNRAQPSVRITSVERQRGDGGLADVTVEVAGGTPAGQGQTPGGAGRGAGVHDVRLFRDGRLVAYAPAEGGPVALDPQTGRAALTFRGVRLPRAPEGRDVVFSAYAFNEDRVKSATDRRALRVAAAGEAVKGRAYVVSVGVNAYENEQWDLRFAANDARRVQDLIAARLAQTGEYEETVRVQLVSDFETSAGRKVEPRRVTESAATKANFKAVLDRLAGREVDAETLRRIPGGERLRPAAPEDVVIVSFSGHGYADDRGNFYLLASDTGPQPAIRDALARAVSSGELSAWLRDVDAGELVLVVDACHSAASVEGGGFKPGPMGSRGLGQLSYDKGMRVLTSTQADDVALEFNLVEMGLLTYALTRDAVERAGADRAPKDDRITVSEWLDYGVERVPQLHAEVSGQLALLSGGRPPAGPSAQASGAKVVRFSRAVRAAAGGTGDGRGLTVGAAALHLQRPSLFDFKRRRRETLLARP